ncbi:MAG: Rpn family recombination-promoting nuclease/putative transposase [bacterium]|nr:Rpn family recombination-promoting nuclease/putative transposase [bacterium]
MSNKKKKRISSFYDKAYKEFFSHRIVFEQFIRCFLPFEWIKKIDFSRTEIVNTTFIGKDYRKKESDIMYRFTIDGKEIVFYVLIEFQSAIDKIMPLRMLSYLAHCYEYLQRLLQDRRKQAKEQGKKSKRKDFEKLPVVIPVVIYRGKKRWNISLNFSDMVDIFDHKIRRFIPGFDYFLLDIRRLREENVKKLNNLVGSFFALERAASVKEISTAAQEAAVILQDEEQFRLLFNFFFMRVEYEGIEIPEELEEAIKRKEENMGWTEVFVEGWRKAEKKGVKKGVKRGVKKGERKNQRITAKNMLADGMNPELVVKYTGLSLEEVVELSRQMKVIALKKDTRAAVTAP